MSTTIEAAPEAPVLTPEQLEEKQTAEFIEATHELYGGMSTEERYLEFDTQSNNYADNGVQTLMTGRVLREKQRLELKLSILGEYIYTPDSVADINELMGTFKSTIAEEEEFKTEALTSGPKKAERLKRSAFLKQAAVIALGSGLIARPDHDKLKPVEKPAEPEVQYYKGRKVLAEASVKPGFIH
jgi:hypothetical protein